MPISAAPYKREYRHTKSRGSETLTNCDSCGRKVPRYKTFITRRSMRLDASIMQQMDSRMVHMMTRIMRLCPACARFRGVSMPGKSNRKKLARTGRRPMRHIR